MWGLWRKELRAIRPFLGLVLVVIAFGLLFESTTNLPNARPMARCFEDYIALGREGTLFSFVLVFALASGLLVREFDEGTMPFLDSLPVSRSRIFAIKVATSMLVVLLLIILDVGTGVLLHAMSRTSLDPSFHAPLLIKAILLRLCQMFIVLSLGLALSFLRRFGWLVLGVLFWTYILLLERTPGIAVVNIFALATPEFEGDRWIVPQRMLAVQMSLGFVALAIAYVLFLGFGDHVLRGFRQLTKSRLGNALLAVGGILVTLVGGSLIYRFMQEQTKDYEPDAEGVVVTYPKLDHVARFHEALSVHLSHEPCWSGRQAGRDGGSRSRTRSQVAGRSGWRPDRRRRVGSSGAARRRGLLEYDSTRLASFRRQRDLALDPWP